MSNDGDAEQFSGARLREHPQDDLFRLHLAQVAMAKQNYKTAAQHYAKLLERQPNNALVLNNLAWAKRQLKDPNAADYAEKANKIAPNQPAIMDTLGVLLIDKGENARGLELLQQALALAPQAAGIRLNLAKSLIKVGNKDGARKELAELAKLGDKFPDHATAAQLMRDL
jgi:Tfp pilus assembly protein PilF